MSSGSSTSSIVTIPVNVFLALINANSPSDANPFVTINDLLGGINPAKVANYSALPTASSAPGAFYWVENSQGTKWLPGSLGGTFYPAGLYYSNGTSWVTAPVPWQATLAEVNAGTNNDTFVTPYSFENADKWSTKLDSPAGTTDQYIDGTGALQDNKTFEELAVLETVSGENIPSYTPCVVIGNQAFKMDASNNNHKFAFQGFSINGTSTGQICRIQRYGTLELLGWGLTPDTQYLVTGAGGLTTNNTNPTEFIKVVGYALTTTTMEIIKDYTTIVK